MRLEPQLEANGTRKDQRKPSVYYPRKSYGWLSLTILGLFFGGASWVAFVSYQITADFGALLSTILLALMAFSTLLLIVWFFSMRYEIVGHELLLYFGPFKYTMDLYLVHNVKRQSLMPGLGISILVPGFAKWYVNYRHEGKVFMCATRACKDIIVIDSKIGKVGVTPEREKEFIEELEQQMKFAKILKVEN